jgi:AraC-like DNA-binding protein
MPVLPVPMIIALLLFGFFVLRLSKRETHTSLLALIAICALQSAISALVHYYGLTSIQLLQPIMAMFIPPIAWLAFSWASGGQWSPRAMARHAIGPALALVCLILNPFLLDLLIALSFLSYGTVILLRLWQGEDSLLHSRLESGARPLWAWRIVGASLLASALGDVAIAIGLAHGVTGLLLWLPSLGSSISLLALGALSLTSSIESHRETDTQEILLSQEDEARDQVVVARVDEYMTAHKPFLDPDLTLSRLARKLVVPAKQLSTAINRVKGENVSRYINARRIDEACRMLTDGKSVTATVFESGFNTKSNFNREFSRVMGKSPTEWLAERSQQVVKN